MRGVALVLVLALPALSGCLSFLEKDDKEPAVAPADIGYDPSIIRVTDVAKHEATVATADGVQLATIVYEPRTSVMAPDGTAPRWGTVIFVHGWGFFKETYEGVGGVAGAPVPASDDVDYTINRLEAFAQAGLIAVAYDARGFGQSTGTSTIAGAAEMSDLETIRQWAQDNFPTNGRFGVVGGSYGGGHAYLAWADNPMVATAVPMYGWVDLYQGLAPGNVPKAEWAAGLGGVGVAGSKGMVSPLLAEWYQKAITRTELESVQAEMGARSVAGRMAAVAKPLFVCQGMQETLFPQVDQAWTEAGGFTRAYVFTGAHGTQDPECWARTLDWFRYFLGGHDTGVHDWPALTTVDASGGAAVSYPSFPTPVSTTYYLDYPGLERQYPSNATFTVSQRLVSNPLQEPSLVWDQLGMPNNALPEQLRLCDDPTVLCFEMAPITGSEVLLGAPTLRLDLAGTIPDQFQVTAQLIHVTGGDSRILTRAAYAAVGPEHIDDGSVTLQFHWVKADLAPGDKIVLKLSANDASWYMPLLAIYDAEFRGTSELHVPFFEG